jgi:N-glycosylase/DNA lyase
VANHFRKLWGQEAGWAQSVLFTANLRSFADRLAATKVEVAVKEDDSKVEIKTEVTTSMALTAPKHEDVTVKVEELESKPIVKKTVKKRKATPDGVIHASQTSETRRTSKRLRR